MWQAPVAVVAFAYCAMALLTVRRSRRSVGNRAMGLFFALAAVTWAIYLFAFFAVVHQFRRDVGGDLSRRCGLDRGLGHQGPPGGGAFALHRILRYTS